MCLLRVGEDSPWVRGRRAQNLAQRVNGDPEQPRKQCQLEWVLHPVPPSREAWQCYVEFSPDSSASDPAYVEQRILPPEDQQVTHLLTFGVPVLRRLKHR